MFDKDGIVLKPLLDEDIPLFDRWLSKDYIYKWLCPDGEGQREETSQLVPPDKFT